MWIGPAILSAVLIAEFVYILSEGSQDNLPVPVEPKQVAAALYAPYLIGVELASMLLLVGIVGAYHLGWRKVRKE
jgi:NADH-quinone oxidoreductase subunit J